MQAQVADMMSRVANGAVNGPAGGQFGGPAGDMMRGPMGGMMRGHPGGFFWGGLFGGLMTALWAAIIVLLILWIAKNWSSPRNPLTAFARRASEAWQANVGGSPTQTPLGILQTRYAKGEINRDEYEMIRRDLVGESPMTQAPPETPAQA